jgi:DNA sulfur modification protein DndB
MKKNFAFSPILLPAIRAKMGDRWYYVATMTFADIASCVQPVDKIHEKAELKTWIQRQLRPERTQQIVDYLRFQKERFFNAIVLGVYDGDPEWSQIGIEEELRVRGQNVGERQITAFGIVHLLGNESLFAIDGQHRVEGIREAIKSHADLAGEEQTVIFISHKTTNKGRERTRRLFSTLNGYARPVPESELIALSEDNAFAVATRRIIDEYSGLNMRFVPLLPSSNIPNNEKTCVTTVVGLYHLTQFLAPPQIRKRKKKHKIGPSSKETVEQIFATASDFWNALKKHSQPIRDVLSSNPAQELASQYRRQDGGNILFRTVGLAAFARAARTMMDSGTTAEQAVAKLSAEVPMELNSELWREVLWRPETETMLHKYVRLAQNVMLYRAGAFPGTKKSLENDYFKITGRNYPN